nr:cytochrome b [Balamuthia mandrillaris]AKT93862.1 cytochrome b [Balamuthia mandrillaris]AKT94928.1 cytochrome b [Balamuthia mandrillaris]AKT94996.1 cytochrome b [Balamuthia mandrillaris]AKT95035.1 cytochrome b [Balamuthia mandrillaris]
MRFLLNNSLLLFVYNTLLLYPVYLNISYWWNYGVLAGLCLVIQIVTGIFLAMYYVPFSDNAFYSVEHIMRDINWGWLLRYCHANGASFFFLVVYIHIFRNIYYQSYLKPRELLWLLGVIILLLMIITAFVGYVLPWGQMSFRAATVITSLFSAIPVIGNDILILLWGAYSVSYVMLNRFFSFHYLLPFIILLFVVLHVVVLHDRGSSNPVGLYLSKDKIPFSPYFIVKDFFGFYVFLIIFFIFVFFYPNYLGHPDNYILANPLVTPSHIVPEWYFLFFYAILRSIPNKLQGILVLAFALSVLAALPFIINFVLKCNMFRNLNKVFYWYFIVFSILLGWLGGTPIEFPFFQLSQFLTLFYFFYFLVFVNILVSLDTKFAFKKA